MISTGPARPPVPVSRVTSPSDGPVLFTIYALDRGSLLLFPAGGAKVLLFLR
ncbi:hypothetical protein ACI2LO_29285 [Streptomyces sp. NPDC033754]